MSLGGIYVHVPFCTRLCPYCDFNVVPGLRFDEESFVATLLREVDHRAIDAPWRSLRFDSIFFGGGTPSRLEPVSVAAILERIRSRFDVADDCQTTLEANPEGLDEARLRALRETGVDRLSIGIQSFDARHLRTLGRSGSSDECRRVVGLARSAGFENLSVDLIFGVPGQTAGDWTADLEAAICREPDHVSAYGLTWEPGTRFERLRDAGKLAPVAEDVERRMFLDTREILEAAGYRRYETSSFARPGFESRHNRKYWDGSAYCGVGPGAHSHFPDAEAAVRFANEHELDRWRRAVERDGRAFAMTERLDAEAAAVEAVFLGVRRADGVATGDFRARFGRSPFEAFPRLEGLVEEGWVERTALGFRLSSDGEVVADAIIERLVSEVRL